MGDHGMDIGDLCIEVGIKLVITFRYDGEVGGCNLVCGSVDSADYKLLYVEGASSCCSGRIVGDKMGGSGVAQLISFVIVLKAFCVSSPCCNAGIVGGAGLESIEIM